MLAKNNILKDKRILVTGGTGFVGSYILRYLIKKDYSNVHSLKRNNSKTDLIADIEKEITFHNADINDIPALEEAVKDMDYVIHTAAVVSFRPKDRNKMMKVNVEGTANLVNICLDNGIKKLIHISSIASLGRKESGKIIDENTEWEDSSTNSDYSISKYLSEMEVWRGFTEGLDMAILNPSMIMGAGYWDIGTNEIIKKVNNGLKFYPTGTNGFVDVRDVAEMAILLIEKDISGERFICSAENIKLEKLLNEIALGLGKKPPKIKLSRSLMSVAAFFIDLISLFPGYNSNLSSQSIKNAFFDSLYDNSKSKEVLGFEYRDINKTLTETAELFKNTYPEGKDFAVLEL